MRTTMTAVAALLAGAAVAATPTAAQQNYGASAPQNIPEPQGSAPQAQQQQSSSAIKVHTPKVSGGAGKAVGDLQKAVNANNASAIPAALAAAQAAAKTPDDRYAVAMLQLKAGAEAKDNSAIAAGIEAMLASGAATPEEKYPLYMNLAQTYSSLKQSDRAAQAYSQALQLNPSSVEATAGLAEAKAGAGQTAEAISLLEKGIALQSAGGAKAPEAWYKRAVAIAYKAKLPQASDLARDWVKAYPTPDSWENALAIYQLGANLDENQTLDLMRLKRAAGVLTPSDYFNYGDIAVRKGFSGEAKSVLDQGFAANKIKSSDPSFSQLYSVASAKTKGDLEGLPAAPSTSATAKVTLNIGDAYYGYGKYDKAVAFYKAALSKSDADANLINLHLGMALARQGDKAGAVAALKGVGGAYAALAQYWLLYAA